MHYPHIFLAAILLALAVNSSLTAKIEVLDKDRLFLTGTIQRSDIDAVAEILTNDDYSGKTLLVSARGTGRTAWEAVHEISKLLDANDIKVEILYAEDAAIAIGGSKTTVKGRLIAWNPVDISRGSSMDVRVWEWTRENGKSICRHKTVSESWAPTVDRFDYLCKARIPEEASDLGDEPREVIGKKDNFTGRRGLRDETGHIWFYQRTGSRGRWSHDKAQDVRDLVYKARKTAERKENLLRRTAEERRRKASQPPS